MVLILPPKQKRQLHRRYLLRVVIAGILLAASAWYIAAAFLVPYVIFQTMTHRRLQQEKEVLEAQLDKQAYRRLIGIAHQSTKQLERLQQTQDRELIADIAFLARVVSRIPEVRVSRIWYERKGDEATVHISGVAQNREALVVLKKALTAEKRYKTVHFPLSSLAAQEEVPFIMSMTRPRAYEK